MNALLATLSCVYSEIMFTIISFFQKLIKGGVGIRAEGELENFSKINKRGGGRLFGTREYFVIPCMGVLKTEEMFDQTPSAF